MARLIVVEDNAELASLIASTARGRGYEVTEALTGRAALAALVAQPFDFGIVDLLLPDMRGGEILAELQQRNIPAVVMSGVYKGHRFAEEAKRRFNVQAFFEKPFELKALLDKVDEILELESREDFEELEEIEPLDEADSFSEETRLDPPPPPRPAGTPAPWESGDEEQELTVRRALPEATAPPPLPLGSKTPAERVTRISELPAAIARRAKAESKPAAAFELETANVAVTDPETDFGGMLDDELPRPPEPAPALHEERSAEPSPVEPGRAEPEDRATLSLEDLLPEDPAPPPTVPLEEEVPSSSPSLKLPFEQRSRTWDAAPLPARPTKAAPAAEASGGLRATSVPRLLNAYYQAKHQGELRLRQGQVQKVVFFEKGQPIYAASNVAKERFAQFVLRKGVVSEKDLAAVVALAKEKELRTSEALMQLGHVDDARYRTLLEEQVKEIIWSTFSWREGDYTFTSKQPRGADRVRISVFPGNLIMEGVARTETLLSLRPKMAKTRKLFPSADPPYALHEITLSGPQALLLAYADGTKTVDDLITLADLSEREALATLYGLELLGLIEERRDDGKQRRISFGL